MVYKVKIDGKEYILPARTLAVDEQIEEIEEIAGLDDNYKSGELTCRDVVEKVYAFVESLAPGAFPSLEDSDTNYLNKAAMDIISAYDAPRRKAKVEAQMSAARELLKNPEIQKLLTVAPLLMQKK